MTKILIDRATVEQALEALDEADTFHRNLPDQRARRLAAMTALKAALAEQEQAEPVEWPHKNGTSDTKWHPPQRKPLTDEEIKDFYYEHAKYQEAGARVSGWWEFARAVERAHGIKE